MAAGASTAAPIVPAIPLTTVRLDLEVPMSLLMLFPPDPCCGIVSLTAAPWPPQAGKTAPAGLSGAAALASDDRASSTRFRPTQMLTVQAIGQRRLPVVITLLLATLRRPQKRNDQGA